MISKFRKISSSSKLISSPLWLTILLLLLLHPLSVTSEFIHIKRSQPPTRPPPFIPDSRYAHTATLVGTKLYFLGGITSPDGNFTNSSLPQAEFFTLDLSKSFDTTQNEQMPWENLTNPSVPAIAWGAAAVGGADNATIYLFGGVNPSDNTTAQDSVIYTIDTIASPNINAHKKRELRLKRREINSTTPTPTSTKLFKKRDDANSLTTVTAPWPYSLTITSYECVYPNVTPLPPCGPGNGKAIVNRSVSTSITSITSTTNYETTTSSSSSINPSPTSSNIPPKRNHLACAIDNQLRIYYLDGIDPQQARSANAPTPTSTSGVASTGFDFDNSVSNDASNGTIGKRIVSEFDLYDTRNNTWSTGMQKNGAYFPAMADYTATYVENSNSIIYIGGINATGGFNDMSNILVYGIDKNQFWFVPASSQAVSVPVSSRIGHSSVLVQNNRIIVYGGLNEQKQPATPELLILDITNQTSFSWRQQATTNPRQASPFQHTATLVNRYMIVAFGRLTTSPDRANDKITLLDVDSFSWVTSYTLNSPGSFTNQVLIIGLLVATGVLLLIAVGLFLLYRRRGYLFRKGSSWPVVNGDTNVENDGSGDYNGYVDSRREKSDDERARTNASQPPALLTPILHSSSMFGKIARTPVISKIVPLDVKVAPNAVLLAPPQAVSSRLLRERSREEVSRQMIE
ncbi:9084_t:CDS:2 [Ambispora leptoticha]|uniref:9084_t:CDS:1 n=1 Tax=Ambispora leptoticha TaxID=144679 RepID=A0A9N8W5V9_9GLOM|nr:9084_t:CDS:2 [Ambispora leptoticha]